MGIFNSIKEKVLTKQAQTVFTGQSGTAAAAIAAGKAAAAKAEPVNVEAVLEAAVKAKGINLNWRTSIVDLLKALDLDSSLAARKELAADLKYSGSDPDGSAEKNIWLHKAVMKALSENGGKVPADLLK